MYGVVNGVYFCNTDRDAELNRRLAEREIFLLHHCNLNLVSDQYQQNMLYYLL